MVQSPKLEMKLDGRLDFFYGDCFKEKPISAINVCQGSSSRSAYCLAFGYICVAVFAEFFQLLTPRYFLRSLFGIISSSKFRRSPLLVM
jgi:hypothetical protein